MTKRQDAIVKMSTVAVAFLSKQGSITAFLPGFGGYFDEIKVLLGRIAELEKLQVPEVGGLTADKKKLRERLVSLCADVIRRIVAYCNNTGDVVLMKEIKISESVLLGMKSDKLVAVSRMVRDRADANLSMLDVYGVTASMLTKLAEATGMFEDSIPKNREMVAERDKRTKEIKAAVDRIMMLWKKIDVLVNTVRKTSVTFYDEYKKVRVIIVVRTRMVTLQVTVVDALSGIPQAKAEVIFMPLSEPMLGLNPANRERVSKITGPNGHVKFIGLGNGRGIVSAKKTGYKEANETVNIVEGEQAVVLFKLEAV